MEEEKYEVWLKVCRLYLIDQCHICTGIVLEEVKCTVLLERMKGRYNHWLRLLFDFFCSLVQLLLLSPPTVVEMICYYLLTNKERESHYMRQEEIFSISCQNKQLSTKQNVSFFLLLVIMSPLQRPF